MKSQPNLIYHLYKIINTGTAHLKSDSTVNRIRVINTLCVFIAFLAGTMGCIIYVFSRDLTILIAAIFEVLAFSFLIILNHWRRYAVSTVLFLVIHNAAVIYFGLVRGLVVEEEMLAVFIILVSILILPNKALVRLSTFFSLLCIVLVKINVYHPFLVVMPSNAAPLFHDLGALAILSLIIITVTLYQNQQFNLINKLRRLNETLEKKVNDRTANLKKANENVNFFFGQFAHDMRNKLAVALSINSMLQSTEHAMELPSLVKNQHGILHAISHSFSGILDFHKIERENYNDLRRDTIAFHSFLNDLKNQFYYYANVCEVEIRLTCDYNVPAYLVTDQEKLDKIVSNLVMNAIKHTKNIVQIHAVAIGQGLLISISDNGKGIPKDIQPKIFEKYVSDVNSDGIGFGLFIVKWLCVLMNIQISVNSNEGTGTVFRLTLPIVEGRDTDVVVEEAENPLDLKGIRVLFIDDDTVFRKIWSKHLERDGMTVHQAESGRQGLQIAREEKLDVILLDSQLSDMTGKDILAEVRQDDKICGIKIIIISGETFTAETEWHYQEADDYFMKPINIQLLKKSIHRLCHFRQAITK